MSPVTSIDLTSSLPAGFTREDRAEETIITAPDGTRLHIAEHEDGAFTWHQADEEGGVWGYNGTDSPADASHVVTAWASAATA